MNRDTGVWDNTLTGAWIWDIRDALTRALVSMDLIEAYRFCVGVDDFSSSILAPRAFEFDPSQAAGQKDEHEYDRWSKKLEPLEP